MKAPEFTDFPDISHNLTIFPVFLIFSETLQPATKSNEHNTTINRVFFFKIIPPYLFPFQILTNHRKSYNTIIQNDRLTQKERVPSHSFFKYYYRLSYFTHPRALIA